MQNEVDIRSDWIDLPRFYCHDENEKCVQREKELGYLISSKRVGELEFFEEDIDQK